MKTITIRELRERWPEAEAAFKLEPEILVTRDSKPDARLVRLFPAASRRPRWNMERHARWQKKVSGGGLSRSDAALVAGRADRRLASRRK